MPGLNGSERWVERMLAALIAAVLAGAILNLYSRSLEGERWRGTMEERITHVSETIHRIERKVDNASR